MLRYFNALWARGEDTAREAAWALILIAGATFIVVFTELLFRPSVGICLTLSIPVWIYSATRIFSVRRYIEIHIAGESLEAIKAVPPQQGILANQLASSYWQTICNLFLLQTVVFLGLPLYVNYTQAGTGQAIAIVMIGTALALAEWKVFQDFFRFATTIIIICMAVGVLIAMFPQLRFYTGADKYLSKTIPGSTADKVAEIDKLRREQREAEWNKLLDEARQWQENNLGKELPQNHRDVIEAASKGITLEQLAEERVRKAEEVKQTEKIGAKQRAKSLADEVSRRELEKETALAAPDNQTPQGFELVKEVMLKNGGNSECATLTPGEYKVFPTNSRLRIGGAWGTKKGGLFSLSQESEVIVFPPSGTKKFSIYRKEGG